jgi:hypothetical protein
MKYESRAFALFTRNSIAGVQQFSSIESVKARKEKKQEQENKGEERRKK